MILPGPNDFDQLPPVPALPISGDIRNGSIPPRDKGLDYGSIPYLTQQELQQIGREQGWQILPTERRINYRADWNFWMGFREFVQNALDETASVDIQYDTDNGISYIVDEGGGFSPISLLLGEVKGLTHQERHCLRGHFGEGMKIAIHPFLREGKRVFIRTAGHDLTFTVAFYPGSDVPIINSLMKPNSVAQGTVVAIEGFDCRSYLDRFTVLLPSDEVVVSIPDYSYSCKVRQVLDRPGDIYFRDIFVEKLTRPAVFGYNLWFEDNIVGVVGPDRSRYLANRRAAAKEFRHMFDVTGYLPRVFKRLKEAVDAGAEEAKRFYEYEMLEETFNRAGYDLEYAVNSGDLVHLVQHVDSAIRETFPIAEHYSWGTTYEDARTLAHLNVYNLAKYLPDLSAALAAAGFCKPAGDWRRLQDTKLVEEVTPTHLREAYARMENKLAWGVEPGMENLDEEEQGLVEELVAGREQLEDVVTAYEELLMQLNKYSQWMCGYSAHLFIKPNQMESAEIDSIGGFCSYGDRKVWVKMDHATRIERLLEVLNHELAHALCHTETPRASCTDLTDHFERYLVKVGIRMFEYQSEAFVPLHRDNFIDEITHLLSKANQRLKMAEYSEYGGMGIMDIIHNHEQDALEDQFSYEEEGREFSEEEKEIINTYANMYLSRPQSGYIIAQDYRGEYSTDRWERRHGNLIDLTGHPETAMHRALNAISDMVRYLEQYASYLFKRPIKLTTYRAQIAQGLINLNEATLHFRDGERIIIDWNEIIRYENFPEGIVFKTGKGNWQDQIVTSLHKRFLSEAFEHYM